MSTPNLDHPTLPLVKQKFASRKLFATEFRGQSTLIIDQADLLEVMAFLCSDERCQYDFLSDVTCVDYLNYPGAPGTPESDNDGPKGRFGVVYNLVSYPHNRRLFVKVMLDPTLDTGGIEDDPALHIPSVCGIWPGAEWTEREVFDMYGIRFDAHPDLRRILLWEDYPAHPLRKDYPVKGRGEREEYVVVDRDSA